jgi:ABC-type transport system involved in Fe-S cluster assembly fused permease/ATPase subunit
MSPSRRLQWGLPEAPLPRHPYRDTLLIYGAFALVIVLIAWATGSNVARAIVIALFFYVAASLWSIARWRVRIRREAADAERERLL